MCLEQPRVSVSLTATFPGPYQVDVALDASTLNERLLVIGLWLIDWQIPHQAKVRMMPEHSRIRISFPEQRHARAFEMQFAGDVVKGCFGTDARG